MSPVAIPFPTWNDGVTHRGLHGPRRPGEVHDPVVEVQVIGELGEDPHPNFAAPSRASSGHPAAMLRAAREAEEKGATRSNP
jgi:hypothetical protein